MICNVAKFWIYEWLILTMHNPPGGQRPQIPDVPPRALFPQYQAWCVEVRESPIQANSFKNLYNEVRSGMNVSIRTSKQGSAQCTTCSLIQRWLVKSTRLSEKTKLQQLRAAHLEWVRQETQYYVNHTMEAKDQDGVWSIVMDGADQKHHDLPKVQGRKPKDLGANQVWGQKLQGVVFHGIAIHVYKIPVVIKAGANMALTSFMRSLQLIMEGSHTVPHTMYIQVDGGKENWNKCTLALFDLLFDLYPTLSNLYVSRLPVGHTHVDLDRFFGYFNRLLFGTGKRGRKPGVDVLTHEDFRSLFLSAMAANKDTMLLQHIMENLHFTYDFWSIISPHLNDDFSGYGSSGEVHVFRFQRKGKGLSPHISYKYWWQSPQVCHVTHLTHPNMAFMYT